MVTEEQKRAARLKALKALDIALATEYDENKWAEIGDHIETIRAALTQAAHTEGLVKALQPFANVAVQIKSAATDGRWKEQVLFAMGDDTDPLKWSLTGKAFNDADEAIANHKANGEK